MPKQTEPQGSSSFTRSDFYALNKKAATQPARKPQPKVK